jgi:hypothetical protein
MLDVPLERDEGEYAYAAQLLLQGIPPYEQVYSMKLPGIYVAYAGVLAVLGQTHTGIHLGLLLVNAATVALIFLLARRLMDEISALVVAASFALLAMSQSVQGVFANAEHFVLLPAAMGLLLLVRAIDTDRIRLISLSGLCMGLAFVTKQHGAAFVAFGGLYLALEQLQRRPRDWRRLGVTCGAFGVCAATPYALTCLILWAIGAFDQFWFWTFTYARSYTDQVPLSLAAARFARSAAPIFEAAPLIWIAAGVGLTATVWHRDRGRHRGFVALLGVFSLLAICPGFFFRPHYFVLLLPAAAVMAGLGIRAIADLASGAGVPVTSDRLAIALATVCLGTSVIQQSDYFFQMTPLQVARSTYPGNPFPEAREIADFIHTQTQERDRIAVIGSEPEIYFYANRRAATGYLYMYEMMQPHEWAPRMQQELINEVEAGEPEFLIFVGVVTSWLAQRGSHPLIFRWFEQYKKDFSLVGVAPVGLDGAVFYPGRNLERVDPATRSLVRVYRRNS